MALHKDFPKSPYEILDPSIHWFPADEALREQSYDQEKFEKYRPKDFAELIKLLGIV